MANREYIEMDEIVFEGDMIMGSLGERIMCALVQEGVVPDIDLPMTMTMSGGQARQNTPVSYNGGVKAFGLSTSGMPGITGASAESAASKPRTRMDMAVFEDRLRLELCHLGLVDVADDDNASRIQDDEIFMGYGANKMSCENIFY
ncbi:hypothetical protein BSLG_009742 [Batrachochytrium salamandrivorans]|nr:hypothetical protein BSLG_009742 [Batrachochytrium salamandrivorans]